MMTRVQMVLSSRPEPLTSRYMPGVVGSHVAANCTVPLPLVAVWCGMCRRFVELELTLLGWLRYPTSPALQHTGRCWQLDTHFYCGRRAPPYQAMLSMA